MSKQSETSGIEALVDKIGQIHSSSDFKEQLEQRLLFEVKALVGDNYPKPLTVIQRNTAVKFKNIKLKRFKATSNQVPPLL